MFCDSCGSPLQAAQQFCSRCGKSIVGGVQPGSSRVAQHSRLLGILWIAYSALLVIPAIFLIVFFGRILPIILSMQPQHATNGPPPELVFGFLRPFLTFIGLMMLAKAFAGIVAGVGLMQRAEWSRMLTIVLACIGLISIPFGTALGVYSLWVLLSPNAELEFHGQGRAVAV